jgi:sulfide dehydrogenase cytochrome subunit
MKLLTTVTLLVLVASSQAVAGDSGQRLYASCAGCHGTAGAGSGGVLPILAGQPKDALAASMRAFRAGTRPATIMQQIAKGFSDEQIAELAAYLAAQPAKQAK